MVYCAFKSSFIAQESAWKVYTWKSLVYLTNKRWSPVGKQQYKRVKAKTKAGPYSSWFNIFLCLPNYLYCSDANNQILPDATSCKCCKTANWWPHGNRDSQETKIPRARCMYLCVDSQLKLCVRRKTEICICIPFAEGHRETMKFPK